MGAKNLFTLFDDQLKRPGDTVAADPQSLSTISQAPEDQNYVIEKLRSIGAVEPLVDYRDFSNFVFFNSALDYFNLTGEKIINEYPYDGTRDAAEAFSADLDGYQRHVVSTWPRRSGHLVFKPAISASYAAVVDAGVVPLAGGYTQQVGALSPGTGSVTVEFWGLLTSSTAASNGATVIMQKSSGTSGYVAFLSGGQVTFSISSGSDSSSVSVPLAAGEARYYGFVYDKTNPAAPALSAYTGSVNSYPVLVSSASPGITGPINVGTAMFYIGSGSVSNKTTSTVSGTLDEVRIWSTARTLAEISSSYNVSEFAHAGLSGLWKFNETGSVSPDDGTNALVFDSSGHRLHGRLINYWTGVRASGSVVPYDRASLILNLASPEVSSFVATAQASGTAYDKQNDNAITRLVPDRFLTLETEAETSVLKDFLHILARQFDEIKIRIDQFSKVLRTHYGQYDQTPDALLSDVARFFGWEFTGNFLSADAFQYLLGKNVLAGQAGNAELDKKLYQIKNEFWRRTLVNLMYLYKSKGTRESVEAFLRVYGIGKNFVRLKEYGYKPNVGIATNRIHAEKSQYALGFVTGSSVDTASARVVSPTFQGKGYSVESWLMFPITSSAGSYPSLATGSIWTINAFDLSASLPTGSQYPAWSFSWTKPTGAETSTTGTLILSGTDGVLSMQAAVFDGRWRHFCATRDPLSGTMSIFVDRLDYDAVVESTSASVVLGTFSSASRQLEFTLGASGSTKAQMWACEARVWDKALTKREVSDHTLNFQAYGTDRREDGSLIDLHWRLRENVTASAGGNLPSPAADDVSGRRRTGTGFGFSSALSPYSKFLFDYNYLASLEFGWNEDKIRVYAGAEVPKTEVVVDDQVLALEFNMVDALNEDVSQILSSMDEMNEMIGAAPARFRAEYQGLEALKRSYFARLQGRLNFRAFADMLEFFDRSFITMVQRLVPARSVFLGDEFVVESHMLERPKHQWGYRRQSPAFVLEGVIRVVNR